MVKKIIDRRLRVNCPHCGKLIELTKKELAAALAGGKASPKRMAHLLKVAEARRRGDYRKDKSSDQP